VARDRAGGDDTARPSPAGLTFTDDEQRERVFRIALDGIRARG
jgi:hypothetical protein